MHRLFIVKSLDGVNVQKFICESALAMLDPPLPKKSHRLAKKLDSGKEYSHRWFCFSSSFVN